MSQKFIENLRKKYSLAKELEKSFKEKVGISEFAHISEEAEIGLNATIDAGVVIYHNTTIGDNVVIRANAVLGTDGVNCGLSSKNVPKRVYHVGELIVEDDVYIGSNTTVQRGTFKATIIGENSIIGPNCDITHQVKIGKCCMITGGCTLSGHCEIGDYTYVGAGSIIKNGVKIGKKCFIGIGSLVLKDVPDGITVAGHPAREMEK